MICPNKLSKCKYFFIIVVVRKSVKWLFCIQILFPLFIHGQIEIYNRSLTDSTLNILYSGIENHMRLKGIGNSKNYTVSISTGETLAIDQGRFDVYGRSDSLTILTIKKNDKKIFQKTYTVRPLKKMVVRVGLIKDSIASKNEVLANPFLNALIPESFWNCKFYITSFSATFIVNRIDSLFTESKYSTFTKEQIELLKTLSSGDRIYFSEIILGCINCRSSKLPPFTLYIK